MVLQDAPSGEPVDLTVFEEPDRVVTAEAIRRLCVGTEAAHVDPRGIRIKGAHVTGVLDLAYCRVPHPLRFEDTRFEKRPDLTQTRLPAIWLFKGCSLPGLRATGLCTDDLQLLSSTVTGTLELYCAKIGGQLSCSGTTLKNQDGDALVADGAEVTGDVALDKRFDASGTVRLVGAKIGGQLICSAATFKRKGDKALVVDVANITNGVFLDEGFHATGEVRLPGANIRGPLSCRNATFTNESGDAIFAEGVEITGTAFLDKGFDATGTVNLGGARIHGDLKCRHAKFHKPRTTDDNDRGAMALAARDAAIDGTLDFRPAELSGGVDLFRANAVSLEDNLGEGQDELGSWSRARPLVLEGFSYSRFGPEAKWNSELRRLWLEHTDGFQHGAWQQLIAVYRSVGRDDEATRSSIAMHDDRRLRAGLPWYRRWARWLLGILVGHGYRPWRAGIWTAGIVAAFALVVWHWPNLLMPEKDVKGSPQPVAYSTDAFFPIIDLEQTKRWTPVGWMRWAEWTVILLGWALTTIFVAGFTRIVRTE